MILLPTKLRVFWTETPSISDCMFPGWNVEVAASAEYINGVSEFRTDGFSVIDISGGEETQLNLIFDTRWSIVSFNFVPNRLEMSRIFAPLVEEGNLFWSRMVRGHF
jgi:hypothetical protein